MNSTSAAYQNIIANPNYQAWSIFLVLLTQVVGNLLLTTIIWYELHENKLQRTLVNVFYGILSLSFLLINIQVGWQNVILDLFSPFRSEVCIALNLCLQFQLFAALMTLNEITILRYLYVYWFKSVGCLNEAFFIRFFLTLNVVLGVQVSAYSFQNMGWIQTNDMYGRCTHLDPIELRENLRYPAIPALVPRYSMITSGCLHLVISVRILMSEFLQKQQNRGTPKAKQLWNLVFSVASKVILFLSTIPNMIRMEMTVEELQKAPSFIKVTDFCPIVAMSVIWPILYIFKRPKVIFWTKRILKVLHFEWRKS